MALITTVEHGVDGEQQLVVVVVLDKLGYGVGLAVETRTEESHHLVGVDLLRCSAAGEGTQQVGVGSLTVNEHALKVVGGSHERRVYLKSLTQNFLATCHVVLGVIELVKLEACELTVVFLIKLVYLIGGELTEDGVVHGIFHAAQPGQIFFLDETLVRGQAQDGIPLSMNVVGYA